MIKRLLAGLGLLLALEGFGPGQASRYTIYPYQGWGGDYQSQGPGTFTTVIGWWGLRAFSQQVAQGQNQAAIQVLRASDSGFCDVRIGWWGQLDQTFNCSIYPSTQALSINAFCAGTTCTVKGLYDQTGHNETVSQATVANQPVLVINCWLTPGRGYLPCLQFNGTSQFMSGTASQVNSVPWSQGGIAIQTGNAGVNNAIVGCNATAQAGLASVALGYVYAGTFASTASNSAPISVPHSLFSLANAASSSIMIDGSLTTGLSAGSGNCPITGGALGIGSASGLSGSNFFTGDIFEAHQITGSTSPKGQLVGCRNANAYYGFNLPLCQW